VEGRDRRRAYEAMAAEDLPRAAAVIALEAVLDLALLDHRREDGAHHTHAPPNKSVHRRGREVELAVVRELEPRREVVHALLHCVHAIRLEAVDDGQEVCDRKGG